ncbi:AlpA family phage regulatory protein [Pseudodesulfovibrio cashew]|uniref:AlpA family phage regulatory protein n=2 Tax=Pseudodesulfovibrio cashew TaxID=2678688 RepID=A0A6I6JKQ5_9BACT|nr:AlpA family phage regulatory protein [Pseudodesulfovibrio cashew]
MNPIFPTEGFARLPQILNFLSVSESTFRRGIRAGKFPKPIKVNRTSVWPATEIRAAVDKLSEREG